MSFVLLLTVTVILVLVCAREILRFPWILYGLSIGLTLLFLAERYLLGIWLPGFVTGGLSLLVQRCGLGMALISVVMHTGALKRESFAGSRLRSVRTELSIAACILMLGHAGVYLVSYAPRLLRMGIAKPYVSVSVWVAIILLMLLGPLGVTSVKAVRRSMDGKTWKRVQTLAYPFFFLIYVHIMLMLLPSALAGGGTIVTRVIVYSLLFAVYVVLRLHRAVVTAQSPVVSGRRAA